MICSAWLGYVDSSGKVRIQFVFIELKQLGFMT